MLDALLQLVPSSMPGPAVWAVIAGGIVALATWAAGARYSASLITLGTVGLGAAAGMAAPRWTGVNLHPMATGIGGALVLGVSGYALHRLWIGLGLGLLLAIWAAAAVWTAGRDGADWQWPAWNDQGSVIEYARQTWDEAPPAVERVLPYACATAMISGLSMALMWPRLATTLMYSLGAVTAMVAGGLPLLGSGEREMPSWLPSRTWVQAGILVAIVLVGAAVQWSVSAGVAPRRRRCDDGEA